MCDVCMSGQVGGSVICVPFVHTHYPYSYVFAKTTLTGRTIFYALFLNSWDRTAYFQYRPEGLEQGFRTILLQDIELTDGLFHHIAVSIFGNSLGLYIDGRLHKSQRQTLQGTLEDGTGILLIGRRLTSSTRYQGESELVCMFVCVMSMFENNFLSCRSYALSVLLQFNIIG